MMSRHGSPISWACELPVDSIDHPSGANPITPRRPGLRSGAAGLDMGGTSWRNYFKVAVPGRMLRHSPAAA
jgi:hypothetical protein